VKWKHLSRFAIEFEGGCGPLVVELYPNEANLLPEIRMMFGNGPPDEVGIRIIFQRKIVQDLIQYVIGKDLGLLEFG
jgi:hypothetical protein